MRLAVVPRRPLLAAVLTAGAVGGLAGAPPTGAQAVPTFHYTAAQLDCARFTERSRGSLDAQTGATRRRETLRRDAVWVLRARAGAPTGDLLELEGWMDSLALAREGPDGTLAPDTDGLLGGRYRGQLTGAGRFSSLVRPFIPDEVAEVAELGSALDDLLPPLPPRPLAIGERWADTAGLELRRLPDSTARGTVIRRLALHARQVSDHAAVRGDTTPVPAREVAVEEGEVDWEDARGLVRRTRRIVVETEVPAGALVRLAVRSRLEQAVLLERAGEGCPPGVR